MSQRRKKVTTPQEVTETPNNNNNDTNTKERKRMPLTPDQIAELLADNRGRGDYGTYLVDFVNSGSAGELVDNETGLLAGKTADKIKTGLENAKKARDKDGALKIPEAQNVLIVKKKVGDEEMVYVINRAVAAGE